MEEDDLEDLRRD